MLKSLFGAPFDANRQMLVTPQRATAWGEMPDALQLADRALAGLQNCRVGLQYGATRLGLAALAALDQLAANAFLLDERLPKEAQLALCEEFRLSHWIGVDDQANALHVEKLSEPAGGNGTSTVTILTSGTTGKSKGVAHSWQSLARPVRQSDPGRQQRWLLGYRPHLYAGLQVTIQALANFGTLVAPDATVDGESLCAFLADARVEYASATPSFWRRLLLFGKRDQLARIPLKQLTLGGEAADQGLLDALKEVFPATRLVHIYATSELGKCYSVTDGREGSPLSYLDGPLPDGIELRVQDGELFIRSANRMRQYDECTREAAGELEWFPTGDLVEIRPDRVVIVGRRSEMINVGGSKVHPAQVEQIIRAVPGVEDVRVFAKRSPVTGQVVACEIVAAKEVDTVALKRRIGEHCRETLPAYSRPISIQFTDSIQVSDAGKRIRREIANA